MSISEVEDLTAFCRVCLQMPKKKELLDLNLIYDEDDQLTYYDCFVMCTQINMNDDDGLPQNLCRSCGLELQMAYDFHKKVDESKRFLSQMQHQHIAEVATVTEEVEDESVLAEMERLHVVVVPEQEVVHEQEVVDEQEVVNEQEVMQDQEVLEEDEDADVEEEEHLEIEEYQAVEQLDDDDAETIQIKINTKSDGEGEYVIEAITLADDDEMDETAHRLHEQITWEDAVVTVANEQHLPVKTELNEIKMEPANGIELYDDAHNEYEDEEMLELELQDEEIANDAHSYEPVTTDRTSTSLKQQELNTAATQRARYAGKFQCNYCDKTFPNHSRMQLHRRSHETDRPKYPCSDCDRVYATKQAMEVHVRTVHIKNGFVCPICSKLYVIKKSLEVHMRYHTGDFPYVCDLCGKKFAQIGHLNTHRNVKHNSVRFSCEYPNCGKFFTSSTSLRNHEFSHGEMPFQCAYCERGYPSKSKLKVHIRRKHDMEMTLEQLEPMRKFKTARSKLNLVKVVECED